MHKWSQWKSRGHGSGDGTPSGVVRTRQCQICRAQEWRDSAVSTMNGKSRPARGYLDAYGYDTDTLPSCLGYDPLSQD